MWFCNATYSFKNWGCKMDDQNRNKYIAQGILIPVVITLSIFIGLVVISMSGNSGRTLVEHLNVGQGGIKIGLILALLFGGGELLSVFFSGFEKPKHNWRLLGAFIGLVFIGGALFLPTKEKIKIKEELKPRFSISFSFGKKE